MGLITDKQEFETEEQTIDNQNEENTDLDSENKGTDKVSFGTDTDVDDSGEMDLLNDLKKSTDKDVSKDTKVEANPDGTTTVTTTTQNKTTVIQYANHELVANLTVAALSVTMCLVLQFISDNWSEEAEKKYLLTPNKKQQILEPLTLVLAQSKAKYNPVVILVITVLVIYVPNFITAFRERKEKNRIAELKKKRKDKFIKETEVAKEVTDNGEQEEEEEIIEDAEKKNKSGNVKTKEVVKTVKVFSMTEGQKKRLQEIKTKRGRRSASDEKFLEEMGLTGLI